LAGINDLKTVSLNSTLAELGMDSMTAVEIKETLERDYEVYLTPHEIRNLTLGRLNELSAVNQCTEVDNQQMEGTHTILVKNEKYIILERKRIVFAYLSFSHHKDMKEWR
jgi:acyl carrier protein